MTLEQLVTLIAKLRSAPSRPVGLWFVDRPGEFYWLLKTAGDEISHLAFPYRFCGIPIHNVSVDPFPEVRYYVTPFYRKPGIWVEMSDGNHVKIVDD